MNLFQSNENDFKYILTNAGKDILLNNIPTKAVIANTTIKNDFNDKYISTLTEIKQGDRIYYNGLYWLIISDVNGERFGKYKGVMRACNHMIGFEIDNKPVCIPVIAYGSSIGVTKNQFIAVADNKMILTMQKNDFSSKIKINDTFVKWSRIYTVEGIDLTQSGLINLHCDQTQLTSEVEYVCTEAGDINDTPESEDIIYSISGSDEIANGLSGNYTAIKSVDGTPDTSAKFNFSIDYLGNSESIATLTIISDRECTIQANAANYYITLVAQDVNTGEIVKKENIRLKNIY